MGYSCEGKGSAEAGGVEMIHIGDYWGLKYDFMRFYIPLWQTSSRSPYWFCPRFRIIWPSASSIFFRSVSAAVPLWRLISVPPSAWQHLHRTDSPLRPSSRLLSLFCLRTTARTHVLKEIHRIFSLMLCCVFP